jgi:hypothetical protein
MAAIEKMIKDFTGADEKKLQAKERLELLKNAAVAHLKLSEDHIAEMLQGKAGGITDLFIVPGSVQNFNQGYTVSTSETVDAGISAAVDQFFSGDVKNGFKTVVQSALSVLFADTTSGEQEKNFYFVTMEHNAFVRVDVAIWKYYFSQKGITDTLSQAFCYTFVKSIIDHTKVSVDTMVYLVSSQVGDDLSKVESFIDAMRKLYGKLAGKDPQKVANEAIEAMRRARKEAVPAVA